jgi:hypothetical protein
MTACLASGRPRNRADIRATVEAETELAIVRCGEPQLLSPDAAEVDPENQLLAARISISASDWNSGSTRRCGELMRLEAGQDASDSAAANLMVS